MSDTLFREKAPVIMRRLVGEPHFGFGELDAAAILGNIGGETGGFVHMQEIKPVVAGSAGGFGWCQWTGPRRRAFFAWCGQKKLDPRSDEANYSFLIRELLTTEERAVGKVKAAKGLDAKVVAFERAFERAGIPHHAARQRWAEKALAAYRASPAPAKPEPVPSPAPTPETPPSAKPLPIPAANPWAMLAQAIAAILKSIFRTKK